MIVLDAEGVSRLIRRHKEMMALVKAAVEDDERVVASAATLVEATDPKMSPAAVRWAVSGIETLPVTRAIAIEATDLLRTSRRHGHADAMDAIVCSTALLQDDAPVTIVTSDPSDIYTLLAAHPRVTVLGLT